MKLFSERLLALRKAQNLTQTEVSAAVGITSRTYQRYECGEREPNLSTLIAFAKFYKVSLDYLAGLTD